jgi:hypothetical protein
LQQIFPEAVLVGGTGAAKYAGHRQSADADHVLTDLRSRFDEVLAELESVAGWKTARVQSPVQILGSLDGIETGVRQLIREQPLETTEIDVGAIRVRVPTAAEMLRIKAVLILKRNATRDYLDFAALSSHLGDTGTVSALRNFDELYPQSNDESALQQLQIQLSEPLPYDLESVELTEYKNIAPEWQSWAAIADTCHLAATLIFDEIVGR